MFSHNPVILTESAPKEVFDASGGTLAIEMGGKSIFDGRFFPPLRMNIAEIIDANSKCFAEIPEDNQAPLRQIEDDYEFSNRRTVNVHAEYCSRDFETQFIAIPGGVSRQNYRMLQSSDNDIFSARFLNPYGNFFFTTRTPSWKIIMKESELVPLYFIVCQKGLTSLSIWSEGYKETFGDIETGVYVLDVKALRRYFVEKYDFIPATFDIYRDTVFASRIVIARSELSRERYRIKFRNSLGVFEIIELCGRLSISPEFADQEDATFQKYDSLTGDFTSNRDRVACRQSVTLDTGVMSPDDVLFMLDMIGSEEVYLLDMTDSSIRVIPSIDTVTYFIPTDKPQKFNIKLTMVENEQHIMPDIFDANAARKPRVFSSQFSESFN